MLGLISKYPRAFMLAVFFHLLAAGAFVINFSFYEKPIAVRPKVDVVQATMIDEAQVQAEFEKLKAIEEKKRKSETERQKKLDSEAEKAKKKRLKEQKRLKELERKRKKELARKKKLEKERKLAEKKRKEANRKLKIAEKKRKQAEKAAKNAEIKRKKEVERQRIAEKKRKKAEADRKAKERAQAISAQQRADDERERQRQIEEENQRLQSSRSKKEGKIINRYMAIIQKQVENNWREPATMKSSDSCSVFVRLMPTGDVLQVEAKKCSGDNIFKRSVEDAVRRASPLSLPPSKSLFKHFREIDFKFSKPKK